MSALDLRMRVTRAALVFFGVPCAVSLAALQLQSAFVQLLRVNTEILWLSSGIAGTGLLMTVLTAWMADRWAVRRQDRKLAELTKELAQVRLEVEVEEKRHSVELKLQEQELETEQTHRGGLEQSQQLKQDRTLGRPNTDPITNIQQDPLPE